MPAEIAFRFECPCYSAKTEAFCVGDPRRSDSDETQRREGRSRLHGRATRVFEMAVRHPPAERSAFLDAAIGNEPALRDEVEALLAHDIDRRIVGHTVPRKLLDALAAVVKGGKGPPH